MDRYVDTSIKGETNVEKVIDAMINVMNKKGFKDKSHRATISLLSSKVTSHFNSNISTGDHRQQRLSDVGGIFEKLSEADPEPIVVNRPRRKKCC